jgi:hypothetical protein
MIFIVSSYFIEVLGNEDVNLEMPKKNLEGLEKLVKPFSRA